MNAYGGIHGRELELGDSLPRRFPTSKLDGRTLDFYRPVSSLMAGAFSPWPLKFGEPTLSVMRFHGKSCAAVNNHADGPCKCPRWRAYLQAELRRRP